MGKSKIIYGGRTFESGDIKSGNCYLAVSLLSDSLEMNTLDFEVESDDTSLTTFTRNAPLTYYNDDEQVGIFFVQKVKRTAKTRYSFECTSAMGLLDEMQHYGGIYTGETVADVVKSICGNSVAYRIKTSLKKIALYGYLPKATARENLSQVLFAIGATVKSDLDGYLRIEGLWDEVSGSIDEDHVYSGGSVEANTPVTKVVVTEHQYIKGTETKTLFEGTTEDGDMIVFDEPMHDLIADGFTILESGVNYARVSTGNGSLTGTAYIHSTREVSKDVTPAEIENVVRVEDATLVSLANANAVAERLAAYYAVRETVEQDVVYGGELPGDVADMAHPYGGQVQSCIESTDITLSGRLRSTERHLVGYKPPESEIKEYYDKALLVSEDQQWAVPDEVSTVRVVLIGGGQGGSSGLKGEDGNASYGGQSGSNGGKGGKGGSGGKGGKVFQTTMEVVPGQTFDIKVGSGGAGAEFSEEDTAEGAVGTDTKFGEFSSGLGAAGAGFLDIFTGKIYGATGDKGIPGGDGGNGGGYDENGMAGGLAADGISGLAGNAQTESGGDRWNYYAKTGTSSGEGGKSNLSAVRPWAPGGYSSYGWSESRGYYDSGYYTSPDINNKVSVNYSSSGKIMYERRFTYYMEGGAQMVSWTTTIYNAELRTKDTRYINNFGGGGGGGAAFKANGNDGGYNMGSNTKNSFGGDGANAEPPVIPDLYGSGGSGGNGGGGGGGTGGFMREAGSDASSYRYEPEGGKGGRGSAGSNGQKGCVIIYYGIPKVIQGGGFVTADGKKFVDKRERQVVV